MTTRFFSLFLISTAILIASSMACKKSSKDASTDTNSKDASVTLVVSPPKDTKQDPEPAKQSATQLQAPFFYKVEGPKGEVGHLLGTMHMGIDAEKDLPPYVWDSYNSAKIITVEADISDPSLAMGMMLPKNTNLRKEIGEETWVLLEEALGKQMAEMLMPMKPAAAASFLAIRDLPKTVPMDLLFVNKAKSAGIELSYLETGAFQLELLTKVMTAEFLGEMLRDPEASDSKKLMAVYRDGDAEAMAQLILDPKAWGSEAKRDENLNAMLYARNRDWIPKLEGLFAKKTAFIAVGAAHLVGKDGVIDLLRKKGYSVARVTE